MSILPTRLRRSISRLVRPESPLPDEENAYRRLASKGWCPAGIVDVGAFEGAWTRMARGIFPEVPVLMVEAQAGKSPELEAVCSELPGVSFTQAVLGSETGKEVTFYEMEKGSSYFPERSNAPREAVTYITRTLDDVAASIHGPLFLKVDVQGAELEVLKGGSQTLGRSEVVQLEVPFVGYNEGAPTLLEVLQFMGDRDFVPFDISSTSRPNYVDLVQADFLFARRDSPLRTTYIEFEHFM